MNFDNDRLRSEERLPTRSDVATGVVTPLNLPTMTGNSARSAFPSTSTPDLDMSPFSAEVSTINDQHLTNQYTNAYDEKPGQVGSKTHADIEGVVEQNTEQFIPNRLTHKQAELYIANQVELLQTAEVHAHRPEQIENVVKAILKHNPDLAQAHFLSYLNCLRVNEYCDALSNLHKCFSGVSTLSANGVQTDWSLQNLEDCNRGFRYAALNLAALHARFNHKKEAAAALREAVMMAQESNDHVCLQHALSWLYRIQPESERFKLIERCISKSQEMGLSYLQSLGEQAIAQFTAMVGLSGPDTVMEILTRSDVLNCQHSILELVTSSYSQKSALWSMYGRSHMSVAVSQLLLNLDTSGNGSSGGKRGSDGIYVTGEATAIAISNLVRHLHDQGHDKLADKLIDLAKSLFPNESSICGRLWRYTSLQVQFERSLHATNWAEAASIIADAEAYCITSKGVQSSIYSETKDHLDTLFMRFQFNIYRGDAEAAANIRSAISQRESNKDETAILNPHQKVRLLILEAELACLTNSYSHAIPPLIEAASICEKHFMQFYGALVALHTAHVQLQFSLSLRALDLVKRCLPMIFAHGSLFECARAKLLLAKCLVAAAPRGTFFTYYSGKSVLLILRAESYSTVSQIV